MCTRFRGYRYEAELNAYSKQLLAVRQDGESALQQAVQRLKAELERERVEFQSFRDESAREREHATELAQTRIAEMRASFSSERDSWVSPSARVVVVAPIRCVFVVCACVRAG